MKTYDSYKETGVQWLGQIPNHWKFSSLIYALKGKIIDGPHETPDVHESGIPFVSVDSINESENVDFSIVKKFISNEDFERFKKKTNLEINDVIFTKAATIGKTAIVKSNDYMVWSPLAILKPSKETYFKYLYYVVSSKGYRENVFLSATFNTQWNIGMRDLEKTSIPRPPYDEQKAIADFLDAKTSELEKEKESLRRQIELSKELKQSIIKNAVSADKREYIKLKYILKHCDNNMKVGPFGTAIKGDDFKTEGYWVYNQRCVLDSNFITNDTFVNEQKYRELESFKVYPQDVLITTRGTIGKIAIVPENAPEGILHPCIIRFVVDENKYDVRLLRYMFNKSDLLLTQVKLLSNSTTIEVLYSYNLKNVKLPQIPIDEQHSIADYLDQSTAEIDEQIKLQEQQIQLIDELKQSIISQAVTGKIKVI